MAVDPQVSDPLGVRWVVRERVGVFQEVLVDCKLGGDSRTGSTSVNCLPDVGLLRVLAFPSHSLWDPSLIVGAVCVLGLSHTATIPQFV